jgi:hypothetical protein
MEKIKMQMTIVVTKAFTISNLKQMTEQEQQQFAEEFGQNVVFDSDEMHLGSAYISESEELENLHSIAKESPKCPITAQDVQKVANDLTIGITDEQIKMVIDQYNDAQEEDPTATWNLVVEHLIHNL